MRKLSFKLLGYFSMLAILSGYSAIASLEKHDGAQSDTLASKPVSPLAAGFDGW